MDPIRETAGVTAHRGRAAGTDAERRTAAHLQSRLQALGRPAELQTTHVHPRYGLTHALHALLVILGSVVATANPTLGMGVVLASTASAVLDIAGIAHLLRRLTGRRVSQNVESRVDGGKAGTLVLVAHYDAARAAPSFALSVRLLRDPWLAMLIAMLGVLLCTGLRALGIEDTSVTAAQFVSTVFLILMVPPLADIELAGADTGAADNAAGVAVVLRLAGELGERLQHFDVWVVLTGAQKPFALGMRAWLRLHRDELDRERTVVVNVDGVGDGALTYARGEGQVLARRTHRRLVKICEDLDEDGGYGARPRVVREASDAAAAMSRRMPAITVSSAGTTPEPATLERVFEFCLGLIERVDAEVGPGLEATRTPQRSAV